MPGGFLVILEISLKSKIKAYYARMPYSNSRVASHQKMGISCTL